MLLLRGLFRFGDNKKGNGKATADPYGMTTRKTNRNGNGRGRGRGRGC
jgi:hypothetical protein